MNKTNTIRLLRCIHLFCLLAFCIPLCAKDISPERRAIRIDSLIFYNDFSLAEEEADRLYNELVKSSAREQHKDTELKLLLQKAYIYNRQGKTNKTLEISLEVIDAARKYKLPEREYEACLMAEMMYEHSNEFDLCKKYLDKAHQLYREHRLEDIYSLYCIRVSSYYRFTQAQDSAIYFARRGMASAKQYGNHKDYMDACLLLGGLLVSTDLGEAVRYLSQAVASFKSKRDFDAAAIQYNNTAVAYMLNNINDTALKYSDSAFWIERTYALPEHYYSYRVRYQVFDGLGNVDSAYHYFKKYHDTYVTDLTRNETAEIKKVTQQYEHEKKEAAIVTKNRQIAFIATLLAVVALATFFLIRKNKKINAQNKVISRQVEELMKLLEQKQVLLSELQHRVKNNLQHVISILEIQKESVDFNNIDELIRGNQNRIHSMALLHKKLNVADSVSQVHLKTYISELATLVKDSYTDHKKHITLYINSEERIVSLEKALPVGLIIVELVSNSMKHAFQKKNTGMICIMLTTEEHTQQTKLYYADNGVGYDMNTIHSKGLGVEIIKGLIGQLGATVETSNNNGFELTLRFK